MRQFDIVRMNDGSLAILLQADLIDDLTTRVVAPLVSTAMIKDAPKLHPKFQVQGKAYYMAAELLSAVMTREIKQRVSSAREREWDIRRALDLVLVGV
jgi:toxin CcdB